MVMYTVLCSRYSWANMHRLAGLRVWFVFIKEGEEAAVTGNREGTESGHGTQTLKS